MATIITADQGFDETYYLSAKAAQLTATTGQTWTAATTLQALQDAGLTPAEHYSLYGYNEGLSPNAYYNDSQYAASKAAEAGISVDQLRIDWYNATGSTNLYTHYVAYGSFETGVNPSTGFNDAQYYAAKAAHDGTTVDAVMASIQDAGLNAVSHYLLYGQYEGLNYTPTPEVVTQNLTLNPDNLSGSSFSAPLEFNGGTGVLLDTLQTADVLAGSSSSAVLNASLLTSTAAATQPSMTNVGTVNLTSYAAGAGLNATLVTGTTTWGDINSANALTIANINGNAASPMTFVMQNVTGTASDYAVNLASAPSAVNLSLNGTTVTGAGNGFNLTGAPVSTLNINTTAAASTLNTVAVAGVTTVNITGDQNLTVTRPLDTTITTLDAAAMTGNLNLNLSGSTNDLTVTGGHGADTLNLAAAVNVHVTGGEGDDTFDFGTQLDGLDVIDGGTGTNTLNVDVTGQAITGLQVSNIQHLGLAVATVNGSIDLNGVTGVDTLTMGSSIAAADQGKVVTVDHAGASIASVDFVANSTATSYFNGLSVTNSYSGTSDTVNVHVNNGGTALATGASFNVGDLNLTGVEHLAVTVADGNATIGTGTAGIASTTMTDLTLTASGNLTVTDISNGTATTNHITTIDATGIVGNANLGTITGLANGATVTLGNGTSNSVTVDTNAHNTIATSAADADNVTVIGGSGADSITVKNTDAAHGAFGWNSFVTGGAGADTIDVSGNTAGVDTINYTHLSDSIISTGIDTVKTFTSGTDKFDVSAVQYAAIHGAGGLVTPAAVAATDDLAADLTTALNATPMVEDGAAVVTINAGGSDSGTYLVLNDGTAGFDATTDAVINITGVAGNLAVADFV